jgi:hypothetical protein
MRRERLRALLVAALIIFGAAGVGLAFGVFSPRAAPPPPPPPPPPAPSPTVEPPPPPPPPGLPVLVVKIDNASVARPHIGLAVADMIYVEPVEGGITRLLAVFSTQQPPVVGPVRSARETDLELLPQFGRPTLAFSGAAPELLPLVDRAPVQNASDQREPRAYFRNNAREMPHNLFLRPQQLPLGAGWSPNSKLSFGPAPPGGVPSGHQDVRYRSASVGFDWSPEQQRWLVSMDGRPAVATDTGRLAPSTVVIQRVPIRESAISDTAGNPSPFAQTVGSGTALVLRDGLAFDARWSRPSPDAGTTYTTASGEPLPFAPGQVWVALTG